ncbi:MAG: NADH-quinone oxidoreductase subunit N, partial [Schwartzia sp. (in: firmicutes)]
MDFLAIRTEIEILVLLLGTLLMDLLLPKTASRRSVGYVTAAGVAVIFASAVSRYHVGDSPTFFAGLFIADNYALFFKQMFLLAILFAVLFSLDYVEKCLTYQGEFYALLLSSLLGMCVLASANDFLTAFVGLELMTISFYILVGLRMDSAASSEAAVKYLVVGAGSTAVLLYGISLVYGAGGSLLFAEVCQNIHLFYAAGLVGAVLVLIGFFFKLSVIPFHMWAPDVYQ